MSNLNFSDLSFIPRANVRHVIPSNEGLIKLEPEVKKVRLSEVEAGLKWNVRTEQFILDKTIFENSKATGLGWTACTTGTDVYLVNIINPVEKLPVAFLKPTSLSNSFVSKWLEFLLTQVNMFERVSPDVKNLKQPFFNLDKVELEEANSDMIFYKVVPFSLVDVDFIETLIAINEPSVEENVMQEDCVIENEPTKNVELQTEDLTFEQALSTLQTEPVNTPNLF